MKKIILLVTLFLAYIQVDAQKMDFWLDTGIKVQYGGSMLFNSAVGDDDNWDYTITTSSKVGGKFGINWNYTGVSLDVMFGTFKGKFQNTSSAGGADQIVKVGSVDAYLLFRDARQKGYFEIGPRVSLIGDVKSENADGSNAQDVSEYYNSKSFAGVVGFGTYVLGNDGRFSGILGLRFEYGFNDLVNADGRSVENRQPVNYAGEAANTVPIFAGLVFELNWGIGGVGQARCGEKSKFIWF